uniref:C-type lectin domain-containing protein n=1 Tax=Leptobrachium leishanense TaxID=445787 RepID=A0A8C5W6I6_9ANUR
MDSDHVSHEKSESTAMSPEKFWVYYKNNPMVLLTYGLIAFLYILIITLFVIVFPKSVPRGLQANINIQTEVSAIKTNKKTCELTWLQSNGRCYYVYETKSNWLRGRSVCLRKGGDLVVITSQQEQDFLISVTNTNLYGYWIGLNTIGNTTVWKWVDGTDYETSYKFWKKGEPSGQSKSVKEECCHLGTDGKWSDIKCSVDRHFSICEKNLD